MTEIVVFNNYYLYAAAKIKKKEGKNIVACKDAYEKNQLIKKKEFIDSLLLEPQEPEVVSNLLFAVDSQTCSHNMLQNNIDQFEWVLRNKVYPSFWGRNIVGENALTKEEIQFLHNKACKVAAIYYSEDEKETEIQGVILASKVVLKATELGIPFGKAIFLDLGYDGVATTVFMREYAKFLLNEGYLPGFIANTDAMSNRFDLEFSRGLQTDRDIFNKCLIWAITPTLEEYDDITTSHIIHPDFWKPYAPSGITRKNIAIWRYGKNCHTIYDDNDQLTSFNLNLVRNKEVIIERMI